jgi:RHS repeat-associated protein
MRTTAGLTWLSSDQHGTATSTIAVNAPQASSVHRETPYGLARDTVGTWPAAMDKGFVGGTKDPTGLTHLGARDYDPVIGRFISADPIVDFADPQQMQGYAYANSNPTTLSDPSGLKAFDGDDRCDADCVALNIAGSELDDAKRQKEEADKVKKKSLKDIIIEAGVEFLLDIFGITDIINCITKGDIGACVNTLIGALPIGRIFKLGKAIWHGVDRVMSAYKAWRKAVKIAEAVFRRADEAISYAKSKFDDLLSKLKGKKKDTPDAPRRDGDAPDGGGKPKPEGCGHSFDPSTQVLMADGSTKAIKDVKVGDEVVTTDPETGQTTVKKITALHVNLDTDLTDVTVSETPAPAGDKSPTGEGEGDHATRGPPTVLHTTANHPFWDATTRSWVDAAELVPGQSTLIGPKGQVRYVAAVSTYVGAKSMRDLTVADIHTYYAVAGDAPVLVHNTGACPRHGGYRKCDSLCPYNGGPPARPSPMPRSPDPTVVRPPTPQEIAERARPRPFEESTWVEIVGAPEPLHQRHRNKWDEIIREAVEVAEEAQQ